MRWLRQLERRLEPYHIPNLTILLISVQVVVYLAQMFSSMGAGRVAIQQDFGLIPARVFEGEIWRVVTFIFITPQMFPLLAIFYFMLFYIMGMALEHHWGGFRYNLYLGIGFGATVAAGLIGPAVAPQYFPPESAVHNGFVQATVFLAFAYLFPDFELLLMFIFPVKVKWLALIQWIGYGIAFFSGWVQALMVAVSLLNWMLFFGADVMQRARAGHHRMKRRAQTFAQQTTPTHVCTACGIDNIDHPEMDFRYCSKCHGARAYCEEHIRDHAHVEEEERTG